MQQRILFLLEETEAFQFVKWEANPSELVDFDNPYSRDTKVKLVNNGQVYISPLVYAKPTATFSPNNLLTSPKNTSIIITFNKPMDISEEDLKRIEILNDGISIKEHFLTPVLSDEKNTITIPANQNNLIELDSGTKTVTVTIPEDFYYLASGEKITMGKVTSYSYKINSETLTKLDLKLVNTKPEWGVLQTYGEQSLNIGQKYNLIFNINSSYAFVKWQIKKIEDDQELYLEESDCKEFFEFDDITNSNAKITVKNLGTGYVIEPLCVLRPVVYTSAMNYSDDGIYKDTGLKVIFSQRMNDTSFYWTAEELEEINVPVSKAFETDTDSGLYYGYNLGDNIVYKNLSIKNRETGENLLEYYLKPELLSNNTILVVQTKEGGLPDWTDVSFTISGEVRNDENITMANDFSSCFKTNDQNLNCSPAFLGTGSVSLTSPTQQEESGCDLYEATSTKIKSSPKTAVGANQKVQKIEISGIKLKDLNEKIKLTLYVTLKQVAMLDSNKKYYYPYNKTEYTQSKIYTVASSEVSSKDLGTFTVDFSSVVAEEGLYQICYKVIASNNKYVEHSFDKYVLYDKDNWEDLGGASKNYSHVSSTTLGDRSVAKLPYYKYTYFYNNPSYYSNGSWSYPTPVKWLDGFTRTDTTTYTPIDFNTIFQFGNGRIPKDRLSGKVPYIVKMEDAFGRSHTIEGKIYKLPLTQGVSNVDFFTISGRGTVIAMNLIGTDIKKIRVEAYNGSEDTGNYSVITGVEVNRKVVDIVYGDTSYEQVFESPLSGSCYTAFLMRGLEKTNLTARVYLYDSNGNMSYYVADDGSIVNYYKKTN